ncbi:MAG TPA: efflux RND transporter periplasmic adaptor subunit [Verrucomicrobiales bacterium]|nr:efflux RND transporter periplasmic adaptor subunit [Verrucomicrobiales bacterium]
MRKTPVSIKIRALACALALAQCGCGPKEEGAGGGRGGREGKVPVLVANVERKPLPITLKTIGNVLPRNSVTVKPKVAGEITAVHFKEGQEVEKDALLFTIDTRPYEVALAKAEADLEKANAMAADAEVRSRSFTNLEKKSEGSVSRDEVNRIQAGAASAKADVSAANAAVKSAKLQVEYCTIRSPQAGRTGATLVDAGNVVTANTTDLVVINQVAPVEVTFSIAGQYLGDITYYMQQAPLKVKATPEGRRTHTANGEVVFLNNQVNRASGTIELRALFQNTERALWPGQFVDVELALTTEPDRVVTPAKAVQTGQEGPFVFVVKEDLTASVQAVKVARTDGDEAVIAEGLKGGERVVIDGQSQLAEGSKVNIKSSLDEAVEGKPDKKGPPPEKAAAPQSLSAGQP